MSKDNLIAVGVRYAIGIDPGVNTGVAVWDRAAGMLVIVDTGTITEVMEAVKLWSFDRDFKVFFEDARQRRWIPDTRDLGREMGRRQGAGSVKRDCQIWEDFCRENGIPYEAVAPQRNRTKLSAGEFASLTGWKRRTNEHGRDAAMLVFGR